MQQHVLSLTSGSSHSQFHYRLKRVLRVFHPPKGSWSSVRICDFLLSFSSCSPRAVRPSVMPCRPLMLLTNLIALFCTASSSCIEAASAGSHRTSAYSSIERQTRICQKFGRLGRIIESIFDASENFLSTVYFAGYVSVKL